MQHHLETKIIRKNQQIIDVDLSLTVLKGPDGKVSGSIGIAADITARKTAQQQLQMAEENYRTIFENSAVAITVADENENIISWNKFAEVLLGLDKDDLYMRPVSSLYPEAEWRTIRSQNVRRKGLQHHLETKIIAKNQEIIDVDLSLTVLKGPDGKVSGSIGIIADITERKRAEEAVLEGEERFRLLVENSLDAIAILNEDGTIRYESPSFERVLGYRPEDHIGKNPFEFVHPDDVPDAARAFSQLMQNPGANLHEEVRVWHRDGSWRTLEVVGQNLLDNPAVAGIVANLRDITEHKRVEEALRKAHDGLEKRVELRTTELAKANEELRIEITERERAEEALREAERRYRAILDNRLQMIYVSNEQGIFLDANDYALERLGYTRDDLGKVSFQDIIHADDFPKALESTLDIWAKGFQEHSIELRLITKSGEIVYVDTFGMPLERGDDHYIELGIAYDITDRKRAEEALCESEENYRTLFESTVEGIIVVDARTLKTIFGNRRGAKIFGFDPMLHDGVGLDILDFVHPEDKAVVIRGFAEDLYQQERRQRYEVRAKTQDGREIWVSGLATRIEFQGRLAVLISFTDITDRKQMEGELQQREQDYLALLESTFEGIVVVDAETLKVVYGNRRASTMFGFDPILKDGVGANILDFVHPEDKGVVIKGFTEDLYQEERRQTYEVRAKTRDGREIWITALGTKTEFQGRLAVLLSTIDVTERKRAEEALRESEEKFRHLVEEMNDGYCVLQGSTVVFANARSAEMCGYIPDEVVGKTVRDLLPPEIVSELAGMRAKRQLGDTVPEQYETTLVSKDGTTHPVELGTRVTDYAGKPALSVVIRDITERKQAEEALRYSEQHFRALIENAQDAIVILNGDGTIRYESPSMERMMGRKAKSRIGKDPSEFAHPDDILNVVQAFSLLLENQTANMHTELRLRHEDGSWRTFEVVGNNLLDNPAVAGIVLNLRDITERKQAEEEIRSLNEELEQRVIERTTQLQAVNKELEAFAYSVSHDLRAPLRSIDGFSQVLLEDYAGRLDEEGKDYLQRVRSGSQRMAELIDDILSLSRVTRGEMQREMVDLSTLAQTIATELQQSQPERQVEFIITPGLVTQGDAHLLWAALENLLGNAWKFTRGQPRARIEFSSAETDGQSAYFVRDNGVGFDMAYADKLFGAFQRLHSPSEFEGTGIGLATVQRIIHRHGGNIWAESAVDQGATFYFTL